MRGIIYSVCCWLIGIWSAILIVLSVWVFGNLHTATALLGIQDQPQGVVIIGWIVAQVSVWGIFVIPMGLIAVLSRRAWPVVEVRKREYFEFDRKIRSGELEI